MICPNCGFTISEGARFCNTCGKPTPEPVYTPPQQPAQPQYTIPPPQQPAQPQYTPPPQPPAQPQSYTSQQHEQPPPHPTYTPPPYGQPQASPFGPQNMSAGSGGVPPSTASSANKSKKPVLLFIIIGVVAILLIVFVVLLLFTDIFSPKANGSETPDRVASGEKAPEQEAGDGRQDPPASELQRFYVLIEMTMEGQDLLEMYRSMGMDISGFYIEFTGEKTMNIVMMGDATECVFSIDGNKITLSLDGDTVNGTIEGYKITLDMEGGIMVYEWDPDFVPSGDQNEAGPGFSEKPGIPGEGGDVRVSGETDFVFIPDTTGVWAIWTAFNGDSDPQLWVFVSNGAELAWDDDSAGNLNALIGLYLIEGEPYTIRAGAYATEVSYSLFVAPAISIWESGDTVNVGKSTVFSFKPYTSGTWVFETSTYGDTDPFLMIVDSNNRHMVSDDDSGEGVNARIAINLTGGQEYIILALTATDEPGPYLLAVGME